MSIFVKVDKLGTGKRLFRCRSLNTTFGEDDHGILTSDSPTDPIFSLFYLNEQVVIQSYKDSLLLDGSPLKKDARATLKSEHEIHFGDYHFYVFNIPTELEVASHSECSAMELLKLEGFGTEGLPFLHYSLAMFKRSFPLPENTEIMVGSGSECGIQIDLKQVKENHFSLINENGIIKITAVDGELSSYNLHLKPPMSAQFAKTTVMRLEPTNLEVTIVIPADC